MREPASPECVEFMRELLPLGEMPPERWVALNAHTILAGRMFTYRYPEAELDRYVRRVDELLRDHANLDALRRHWLSPTESERVQCEQEQVAGSL
jgi:hypothetical protein